MGVFKRELWSFILYILPISTSASKWEFSIKLYFNNPLEFRIINQNTKLSKESNDKAWNLTKQLCNRTGLDKTLFNSEISMNVQQRSCWPSSLNLSSSSFVMWCLWVDIKTNTCCTHRITHRTPLIPGEQTIVPWGWLLLASRIRSGHAGHLSGLWGWLNWSVQRPSQDHSTYWEWLM